VGQGIVKALRISDLPLQVISSDIAPANSALYRADEAMLLPKVEDAGALSVISDKLRKNNIQVVMIGSEFDLSFFSHHRAEIERASGAKIIVSPPEVVEIANDKWLSSEFLRKHNLPHAKSCLPESCEDAVAKAREWGFPLVLKTRRGTSSRHVHIVKDEAELIALFGSVPTPMLQEMIATPSAELENEYTCSVFRCADGTILGPFTARRTLRGGSSWHVEVGRFEELHPLLLGLGENLPSMGTLNVQLMMGKSGPVPFEFNARFSGTTAVRAYFGFNEPEMAIRNFFLGEKIAQPVVRSGIAFRYLEEVFLDGVSAKELREPFPKGRVLPWF